MFRDFNAAVHTGGQVDFADSDDLRDPVAGLVESALDQDGKPVFSGLAGGEIDSVASFAEWYRDVPPVNARNDGSLLLFEDRPNEVFTNRSNDAGDRFRGFPLSITDLADAQFCSDMGCDDPACATTAPRECTAPCAPWGSSESTLACTATAEYFDGNPLFFPLDGAFDVLNEPRHTATLPPAFGFDFTPEPGGALHNFYFTSEIRFKARYSGVNSAAFQLTTDDDGWIFHQRPARRRPGAASTPESALGHDR